jgi:hypothetical protein
MSASDDFETRMLKLVFNNTTYPLVGDATGLVGSTAAGSVYVALHTADPGETGTQATSEATYTGYARQAVARTTGGWTISGTSPTQAANAAAITFGACTAGTNTLTHFSIGHSSSGATAILFSGALTSSITVSTTQTPPTAAIGALVVTCD